MPKSEFWLEVRRQIIHVGAIVVIPAVLVLGELMVILGLAAVISIFAALSACMKISPKSRVSKLVYMFERKKEHPFSGATYWMLGSLLALLLFSQNASFAGIAVLAIADSASTMIGKYKGKRKLPINKKKTWEGSATFFLMSALVLQFFANPLAAIGIAVAASIIEMAPKINDNVSIPVSVGFLVMLLV